MEPKKNITQDGFLNAEGYEPAYNAPVQQRGGMSPSAFCYWLQGYFENVNPKTIGAEQTLSIKNHLQEVFHKVTPAIAIDTTNPSDIMVCDTGTAQSIWDKYGDKLPAIFKRTIYRVPTESELRDVARVSFTAPELIQGFTYTMVGRGVCSPKNKSQIIQSLTMLWSMYPDRPEYLEALGDMNNMGGSGMLTC